MLRNTSETYGLVAIFLHWIIAVTVIGLFALGLYMTGLSYYDANYKTFPDIHRSIGVLLFLAMLLRLLWRWANPRPQHLPSHKHWERRVAGLVHGVLYLLLFVIMISGYLISTADGRAVDVFGWFSVPATLTTIPQQEDVAGDVHYWLAVTLMVMVALHAAAALKHHFVDGDATLKRMLGTSPRN